MWHYNLQRAKNMATTTWRKKKRSFLVIFKQNIELWKDPRCSCWVCKTYIEGFGFIYKNHADSSCFFCSIMLIFLFFYLSIQGSTYNFLTLSLFRLKVRLMNELSMFCFDSSFQGYANLAHIFWLILNWVF